MILLGKCLTTARSFSKVKISLTNVEVKNPTIVWLPQPKMCQLGSKDHDDLFFWLHKNLHIVKTTLKPGLTLQTHKVSAS